MFAPWVFEFPFPKPRQDIVDAFGVCVPLSARSPLAAAVLRPAVGKGAGKRASSGRGESGKVFPRMQSESGGVGGG